ncbi:MAG TPA: hypothetical protein VKA27_12740 [Sunxiuqinia sp.]|nr:hypothetical protein [Sunxiuqinia sp.]
MKIDKQKSLLLLVGMLVISLSVTAGPPYNTDDPDPTPFKHWEYYISTINNEQGGEFSGTLPHFEVNYGIIPNVMIHLVMPLSYDAPKHQSMHYGYGDTEMGFKYRFVKETDNCPEIGTFPIALVPIFKSNKMTSEKAQFFVPVWLQKSWGKLTTFGGGGYWFNPGAGNKNSVFTGLTMQYDFSEKVSLGEELYYQTAATEEDQSSLAFNLGGQINFSKILHLIFSAGHSLVHGKYFTSYLGLWWTI